MNENVEERIKAIVASRLEVPLSDILPESSFIDDLGADSLDVVDLAMAIEQEFSLHIKDHDYIHLTRIKDATLYIAARLAEPASDAAPALSALDQADSPAMPG